MLNKKSMKILTVILLAVVLLMVVGSPVFATDVPKPALINGDNLDEVNNTVETILGIIQWGGIIAAVVMAMFIGIKYITASPDGKAEVKKTLAFYIAGCAILLSASAIVGFIQKTIGSGS